MDSAWTAAPVPALQATVDSQTVGNESVVSNRLTAQSGALNSFVTYTPTTPLDLSTFDELRFWIRSNRAAHGTRTQPFYLEFSFFDANDLVGDEHHWFVPINRVGQWEQRRIGIEGERRSAVTSFRFRALTDLSFTCFIDELLAVHEELLTDLEMALISHLGLPLRLPGLSNITLRQTAPVGSTQLVLPHTPGFHNGNQLLLQGGSVDQMRHATQVVHDSGANSTTIQVDTPFSVELAANAATASLLAPTVIEVPPTPPGLSPGPATAPSPAVFITYWDGREDLERTGYYMQRDSFRPRGNVIVCSTRPAPRAFTVDYQLTALAPTREQQRFIQQEILRRVSMDQALRVNGYPAPVFMVAPPELQRRQLGELAPIYLRIGTRMESAPRQEQTWVQRTELWAAPPDTPLDREVVTLELGNNRA
jgi:hypothetical protein